MRGRSIVITGASRGLGAALAREAARRGASLGLVARSAARLENVATACRSLGAGTVRIGALDVTDGKALTAWLAAFDEAHPVDVLIANAGVFGGHPEGGKLEPIASQLAQIEINVAATLVVVDAIARRMMARGHGRIAIVSSLAALHPLADAPAYSASKAAVAAYGEALREHLAPFGVGVSVIHPGHVATDQTRQHKGPLPALMAPDRAAAIILDGLDRGRSTISFPVRLRLLIAAGRLLPWRLRARINRPLRFSVKPHDGENT